MSSMNLRNSSTSLSTSASGCRT